MIKLLFVIMVVGLAATATYAQSDTTRNRADSAGRATARSRGLSKISAYDLPSPVRETLKSTEYDGWENAPIYKNSAGTVYTVELKKGTTTKRYRFDANGKLLVRRPDN